MRVFKSIVLTILLSSPVLVFSQSKLGQITNLLNQDSSKPKSTTGTQSNLAVSDEGKGGGKQNSKSASSSDKSKDSKNNPSVGTNLAVSDEGKGGVKGKSSTTKEGAATDSTQGKEIKKEETKTAEPK